MKLPVDIAKMKKLVKPWEDLARQNRNRYIELYNKKGTEIGIMEQGKDGFTEIIIGGPWRKRLVEDAIKSYPGRREDNKKIIKK